MIRLTIETQGYREQLGRFATWGPVMTRNRRREAHLVRARAVSLLKKFAPRDTGIFSASLSGRVVDRGRILQIRFTSSDPKANLVINPTRPHVIEASRGLALRFTAGGGILLRKRVLHPGTKGSDFVQRVARIGGADFIRAMNKVGVQTMIAMAGRGA